MIETPYRYAHERGDPLNLLRMSRHAGLIGGVCKAGGFKVLFIYPHTWKKQVPKEIMTARIVKGLAPEELATIPCRAGKYQNDIVDAVGIAKWYYKNHTEFKGET